MEEEPKTLPEESVKVTFTLKGESLKAARRLMAELPVRVSIHRVVAGLFDEALRKRKLLTTVNGTSNGRAVVTES